MHWCCTNINTTHVCLMLNEHVYIMNVDIEMIAKGSP